MPRRKPPNRIEAATLVASYCQLPAPRSLTQLAKSRGLDEIPPDWHTMAVRDGWERLAGEYDERQAEDRLRTNWTSLVEIQAQGLHISQLLLERVQGGVLASDDINDWNVLSKTLKTTTEVAMSLLEGLQTPDSVSALPEAAPQQLSMF